MNMKLPLFLISLSGFIAVAMGAAGAHAVHDTHGAAMVQQAALYHLIHTAVLLYLLGHAGKIAGAAKLFFALGIVLFSGSLYLRYAAHVMIPPGVVPAGGICYMLGWLMLALSALRR